MIFLCVETIFLGLLNLKKDIDTSCFLKKRSCENKLQTEEVEILAHIRCHFCKCSCHMNMFDQVAPCQQHQFTPKW